MKNMLGTVLILTMSVFASVAQPAAKPKQKQATTNPPQSDMNKMLEEAMKGENMSAEEKEQMKKMMKDIMPSIDGAGAKYADYPEFTSNKALVPKRDALRISSISKKIPTQADIAGYAGNLYAQLMAKGKPAETTIVKQVIAKTNNAVDIHSAAILAMLQGHPEAAMALMMKAVQMNPSNTNYQNNMAALLTQYGYPEQSIPVLQKLKNQYPYNSTVLNNMAQAWLGLGETDSVKKFAGLAVRYNPRHSEAKTSRGLIEELKGDHTHAVEDYEDAMDGSPNPFTDAMMQNAGKSAGSSKLDWEKIRRSIAIYEYFPKNWIKTSMLNPSVSAYVQNQSLREGYHHTDAQFDEKIESMMEETGRDIQNLAEKGEEAFVKELGNEMIAGVNFMSKPAALVMKVLHQYGAEMMNRNAQKSIEMGKKIEEFKKEYEKATKNATKCQVYDAAANRLMENVNPMIYKFYSEMAEECRQWLNALATWNWYLVGNPKNTILMQDLGYAAALEGYYNAAMEEQLVKMPSCSSPKEIAPAAIPPHDIPNFTCPAIVSIPVGPDWQQLTAASADFNKNGYNMLKDGLSPIPNTSMAFGIGTMIAQPGIASFAKTANGSISPGNINTYDDELTPLSKIEKDWDLTPLPNIPKDELTRLPDLSKSKYAKSLLEKMMKADCKNVKNAKDILKAELERMMKSVKELEAYEQTNERIKEFGEAVEKMEASMEKKQQLKSEMEKFQKAVNEMDKYEDAQTLKKKLDDFSKAAEAMENSPSDKSMMKEQFGKIQRLVEEMENAPGILQDIKQNGIQVSISGGIQAPGTFAVTKGLLSNIR